MNELIERGLLMQPLQSRIEVLKIEIISLGEQRQHILRNGGLNGTVSERFRAMEDMQRIGDRITDTQRRIDLLKIIEREMLDVPAAETLAAVAKEAMA